LHCNSHLADHQTLNLVPLLKAHHQSRKKEILPCKEWDPKAQPNQNCWSQSQIPMMYQLQRPWKGHMGTGGKHGPYWWVHQQSHQCCPGHKYEQFSRAPFGPTSNSCHEPTPHRERGRINYMPKYPFPSQAHWQRKTRVLLLSLPKDKHRMWKAKRIQ
jgi:hypothetical protein